MTASSFVPSLGRTLPFRGGISGGHVTGLRLVEHGAVLKIGAQEDAGLGQKRTQAGIEPEIPALYEVTL